MPVRRALQSTPAAVAARRANSKKSTGPRTPAGQQQALNNLKRHFGRLGGVPKLLALDQEPGVAIDLYARKNPHFPKPECNFE